MTSRISTGGLQKMADSGNALAKLCLSQRTKIAQLQGEGCLENDPKSERIIRSLQAEIDRLNAEIARLKSQPEIRAHRAEVGK